NDFVFYGPQSVPTFQGANSTTISVSVAAIGIPKQSVALSCSSPAGLSCSFRPTSLSNAATLPGDPVYFSLAAESVNQLAVPLAFACGAGDACSFAPAAMNLGAGATVDTDVTVAGSTATSVSISVTGNSGGGTLTRTAQVPLLRGDFTLATPPTLSVLRGGSGQLTVQVQTGQNFVAQLSFTCSGLPAGASCSAASADGAP